MTDRQTDIFDGKDRGMQSVARVKLTNFDKILAEVHGMFGYGEQFLKVLVTYCTLIIVEK